jgi:hypothetical protein
MGPILINWTCPTPGGLGCAPETLIESSGDTGQVPVSEGSTGDPVRAFTGQPIINSTGLSSNAFGKSWSYTRAWSGLNDTGLNGNGWTVTGLPYLAIQSNQYPGSHPAQITVVEGGQANRNYLYDTATAETSQPEFADDTSLTYVPPTTAGVTNVPGEFRITDSSGAVTAFYDVPRSAYSDGDAGTSLPVEEHGRINAGATVPQAVSTQWFDTSTGTRYDGVSGR